MKSDKEKNIAYKVLTFGFLFLIFSVPVLQAVYELKNHKSAGFVEIFRYSPTENNLRAYEKSLEESWWGNKNLRKGMLDLYSYLFGDTGERCVLGRDNWLFYRPGLRYLTEPDRLEENKKKRSENVIEIISKFRNSLREKNIELVVVPVPEKPVIYPEMLAAGVKQVISPSEEFLKGLSKKGINTVDLFTALREAKEKNPKIQYYLKADTHWTPAGAEVAARKISGELIKLKYKTGRYKGYSRKNIKTKRRGDLVGMLGASLGKERFEVEEAECGQILDNVTGLIIPDKVGVSGLYRNTHLIDTEKEASVLLLGDSFSRIYQLPEANSLGENKAGVVVTNTRAEGSKTLLPGSAGLPSLLAWELQSAVDYILSDGGAAKNTRLILVNNMEILRNKKVVIWEFTERDIASGFSGWDITE
ncbi:MAG: hypothetical protein A2231_12320 [Candidatus Firestonebacteria bacterium RIFOXYA2_FULL_40_8]|nr:MAG: hypothetical protein A2231_12320 [Candidatus Firestonebacteria bacterium RIFOXYA2_FULL_40_8]